MTGSVLSAAMGRLHGVEQSDIGSRCIQYWQVGDGIHDGHAGIWGVAMTLPNTVNPPFIWCRREPPLSARLINHSLVALSGLPDNLAIAMVPATFDRDGENSF